ncbi:MAG: hypothetical protein QOF06_540 [Solirubrobacterales bacterium]|jgi:AcrR family transcriptional regulator|nr:hypothetical protein [Solirubrobacterales bacterium]
MDGDRDRRNDDARARKTLGLAALETSGEQGYLQLTVQKIIDRAELDRQHFYRCFEDQWACYATAYADTIDELVADLLNVAGRQKEWLPALGSALDGLARFIEAETLLAKGILLEVHVAGGRAITKRNEVFERLSRAIDRARRENASRHSPPPMTAQFILNMIEAAVSRFLTFGEPERFADSIPDLLYIAASTYFGREVAEARLPRPEGAQNEPD